MPFDTQGWCFRARYENDAGVFQGMAVMEYLAEPEPGADVSGVRVCCGGAIEQTTGDEYFTYCIGGTARTTVCV